ncbi:MAG: hypothetical protein GF317_16700, partial [Candidatus Lokiarchaeota archaeon]|nr:hypothetical protein [Candidatus Lokiarchaeota archaeon]
SGIENDTSKEILWEWAQISWETPFHEDTRMGDFDMDENGNNDTGTYIQDISNIIDGPGWYYLDLGIKTTINDAGNYLRPISGFVVYFDNISITLNEEDSDIKTRINQTIDLNYIPQIQINQTNGILANLTFDYKANNKIKNNESYLMAWINNKKLIIKNVSELDTTFTKLNIGLNETFRDVLEQETINISIGLYFPKYNNTDLNSYNIIFDNVTLNFTDINYTPIKLNNITINDSKYLKVDNLNHTDQNISLDFEINRTMIYYKSRIVLELQRQMVITETNYTIHDDIDGVDFMVEINTTMNEFNDINYTIDNFNIKYNNSWDWRFISITPSRNYLISNQTINLYNLSLDTLYTLLFNRSYLVDLSITNISLDSTSIQKGTKITVAFNITNSGEFLIENFTLSIYVENMQGFLTNITTNIAPNSNTQIVRSFQTTDIQKGEYRIMIIVDSNNQIPESNESNIFYSEIFQVTQINYYLIIAIIIAVIAGIGVTLLVLSRRKIRKTHEKDTTEKTKIITSKLENLKHLSNISQQILNKLSDLKAAILLKNVYDNLYDLLSESLARLGNSNIPFSELESILKTIRILNGNEPIPDRLRAKVYYLTLDCFFIFLTTFRNLHADASILLTPLILEKYANDLQAMELLYKEYEKYYSLLIIEHLIIIKKENGTCLYSQTIAKDRRIDPDLVSGFLTAFMDFGGSLNGDSNQVASKMEYKNFTIQIETGDHIIVALLAKYKPRSHTIEKLRELTRSFERKYIKEIIEFSGNIKPFSGAKQIISDIFTS